MSLEALVYKFGFNIRVASTDQTYKDGAFTILSEDGPQSYSIMYDDGTMASVMRSCEGYNDYDIIPEQERAA